MSGRLASDAPQHGSRHNCCLAGDFPQPPHKTAKGGPARPWLPVFIPSFPSSPAFVRCSTVFSQSKRRSLQSLALDPFVSTHLRHISYPLEIASINCPPTFVS